MILEKLGIPDNIIHSAKKLWDETILEVDYQYDDLIKDEEIYYLVEDIEISDKKVNNVYLNLNIKKINGIDKPKLSGMSILHEIESRTIKSVKYKKTDDVRIVINIYIDNKNDKSDIINLLFKDKVSFISSFAHELKHHYDYYKKKIGSSKTHIDYIQIEDFLSGISCLDKFFYYLYYSHSVENLVRATEVGTYIKVSDIKKKEFLKFLKSNIVYKNLDEMSKFNIEFFNKELLKNMDKIIKFLNELEIKIGTDKENIEKLLSVFLNHTFNKKVETLKKHIKSVDPMLIYFTDNEDLIDQFFGYYNKMYDKYENKPIKFFEDQIKMINFIGNKYKRKVIKLYDIIDEEPIEIHNKINNKLINFKKFKNGKN
tara:strand:+ start:2415 stop:3527 length:1113 start_codon:yes stop_codon:yes gene_type:complete